MNELIESLDLPNKIELPNSYKDIIIEEYLPNCPFWMMDEKKYKNLSDVPANEKGNFCIDCEPGSEPVPFIVIYNNPIDKIIGLIHPYVMVVDRIEPKSIQYSYETTGSFMMPTNNNLSNELTNKKYVKLRVGGDTDDVSNIDNIKKISDKYIVTYQTYDQLLDYSRKNSITYNFGNFGNYALPNESDEFSYPIF